MMDGTSPGLPPMSLGDVWVGTTACAPNPQWLAGGELFVGNAAQNCIIDWPNWQPLVPQPQPSPFQPSGWQPVVVPLPLTIPPGPTPARLSDEDVERIADRVIEKLRGAGR